MNLHTLSSSALPLLALLGPAFAHDDDPKILDRRPPTPGKGWRLGDTGNDDRIAGFNSNGVQLLSWMPMSELDGSSGANDCWGYTSPSGREYAVIGTNQSTCFVEISNPSSPQLIQTIGGPSSLWRDVKVYQDHAYTVTEGGGGIQVMSMANIDNGTVSLVNTVNTPGTSTTHNVAIDEVSGRLYRTGGGNEGLRIYDLSNPAAPSYMGGWSTRYVHDAQIVTYTSGTYAGRQIAFCFSGFNGGFDLTGLDILDVTNPGSVIQMARILYPDNQYSHQGWLTPDLRYLYLGDELDEDGAKDTTTHIFDVQDLDNPTYLGAFDNNNSAVGHNMYSKGDLLYEANYTSGLRVFDISTPTSPVETSFFDTSSLNGASFNGLWSCYPYFDSGVVIGSDLESGLFVWYVGDTPIDVVLSSGVPQVLDPGGDTVAVQIIENTSGSLEAGSESLFYDVGAGFVEVPLNHLGGIDYEAVFPAIDCGESVEWYVGARSTGGLFWGNPAGAPSSVHTSLVANAVTTVASYDMEAADGWVGGAAGDNATTGLWTRGNPNGTAAQPEDDHTPSGTRCWYTGFNPNGELGNGDVDGGRTTLLTPTMDLTGMSEPVISYWRWYSNSAGSAPNSDVFEIDISFNGGSSWSTVEDIGPTGAGTSGGWIFSSFSVADLGTPTANVRMRFIASDLGSGSIVEAAIDDFEVLDLDCGAGCTAGNYCTATQNSSGQVANIGYTGSLVIPNNDFGLFADSAPAGQFGIFFYGPNQIQVSFGNGFLCAGGGLTRLPLTQTDAFGIAVQAIDFNNLPNGGELNPGDETNFQFWFRDPMGGGARFNTTDALNVHFCE